MPISLDKLNISLDKFNAVSGGTYNIGHLKLNADGTDVYRTNNRKTLTFLNRTEIKSDEALAVKLAFCKALESEGLSEETIKTVRAKLGIPDSGVDTLNALKKGSLKPLTAADVREIIDTYAQKINENRVRKGMTTMLQTSKDIYTGVSEKTLKSRAETRNKINTNTIATLQTSAENSDINSLLDILEYSPKSETDLTLKAKGLANELAVILKNSGVKEGRSVALKTTVGMSLSCNAGGKISAKITFGGGNTMTLDTGYTKQKLLEQLDKILNGANGTEAGSAKKSVEGKKPEAPNSVMPSLQDRVLLGKLKNNRNLTSHHDGNDILNELESAFKKIKNSDDKMMLYDLAAAFAEIQTLDQKIKAKVEGVLKNPVAVQKYSQSIEDKRLKEGKPIEDLQAETEDLIKTEIKSDERGKIMKRVIGSLLDSLKNARGIDARNSELVNEVSKTFDNSVRKNAAADGNAWQNVKKLSELIKDITLVLTKPHIDSSQAFQTIVNNIPNNQNSMK